jgi:hypothetical protein
LESIAINNGIQGFVITSAYRSPSHNKSIGGVENSLHTSGRAIDLSPYEAGTGRQVLSSSNELSQQIKSLLKYRQKVVIVPGEESPGAVPTNELWYGEILWHNVGSGNHLHIGYEVGIEKTKINDAPFQSPDPEINIPLSKPKPIVYVHKDLTITDLQQLVENYTIFEPYRETLSDLENYSGGTNKTNRERMEDSYTEGWTLSTSQGEVEHKYPLLLPGTVLYLDPEKIQREVIARESDNQIVDISSFPLFIAQEREKLESNVKYRPVVRAEGDRFANPVQFVNNFVTVWVYCKSLEKIIDITEFCNQVTTYTDMSNSDSFSLSMSFFEDVETNLRNFQEDRFKYPVLSSNVGRDLSYLFKNLTPNDIVWIKYEELECEGLDSREQVYFNPDKEVPKASLPNQIYDMIGLIDTVAQSQDIGGGSGGVVVQGRSLVKVFSDDEAIFIPAGVMTDSRTGNMIIGPTDKDDLLKRNFVDGEYKYMLGKSFKSVEDSLKFILNQLSNIGRIAERASEELFSAYGDRRSRKYSLRSGGKDSAGTLSSDLANGVYQIIKLSIDKSASFRTVADGAVTNPNGSVLSLINKVCQPPLVEFCADTYGDTFNLVVRKPPFDRKSILSFLEGNYGGRSLVLSVDLEDIKFENLYWNTDFYTWYDFELRGQLFDSAQKLRTPYVYLSEYVDLWGSKRFSGISNYVKTDGFNFEKEIGQVASDLVYLIESTAYLPFTRRGTITLNKGDRRFKKGTWFRYLKTGEVFYIDGVINSSSTSLGSISRQTTLMVSRGMVETHLHGFSANISPSYFNIINLEGLREQIEKYTRETRISITRELLVNKNVFDFFRQRSQFNKRETTNKSSRFVF